MRNPKSLFLFKIYHVYKNEKSPFLRSKMAEKQASLESQSKPKLLFRSSVNNLEPFWHYLRTNVSQANFVSFTSANRLMLQLSRNQLLFRIGCPFIEPKSVQ